MDKMNPSMDLRNMMSHDKKIATYSKPVGKQTPKKYNPKQAMSDEEIRLNLHIPPRDEKAYPGPDRNRAAVACEYLYKIGALAGYDGNLDALLQGMYIALDRCLDPSSDRDALAELLEQLKSMRGYIAKSKTPGLNRSLGK